MPPAEPFNKVWEARRLEQDQIDKEAFRRTDEPTKNEADQDKALAEDLIRTLGMPRDNPSVRSDLIIVLGEARLEYNVRRNIRQSLPVIGGVQPKHGEMRTSLKAALQCTRKLGDAVLPLFHNQVVSFAEGDIPLRVVIEQLTETLTRLDKKHKRRGRAPGSQAVAQSAARYLVRFMRKHAPETRAATRKNFLFAAARALEITCPDLDNDPGAFNAWFHKVEALEPQPSKPQMGVKGTDFLSP